MLFDLEDYRVLKVTGPDHKPAEQINWEDPYTTARATRDAYLKAINEYFLASQVMSTKEEMIVLNTKMNNILESNLVLNPLLKDFFNAMSSLAILPGQAINEGDRYKFIYVPINDTSVDWFECTQPTAGTPISWGTYMSEGSKKVAVLEQEGDIYYKEMTQALYDSYNSAFVDFQSKVKDLIIVSEGGVEFTDYVAPAVPVWNSYPELSGYVRGTNNLTIKDAVVRLIDGDGVNHDVVADDNGYYKFSKEMFYNNIAFDHGATASNFNMFVLEHKLGSTASLYDSTSIFQNSFFGAENDRDFTWPVQVKMGKESRRSFKLEFLPDYSNYPSFSGYVKDATGTPIKDAFVMIKDGFTGYCIGNYKKSNGDIAMNYKYNDFGVDRTILTDENGFYEYTSQMVGEWFNKQLMQVGEVTGNLGGRLFDEYFGSREDLISFYDSYSQRNLQYKESFFALLIPYKQDVNSNSVDWEGTPLYDNNDYYASRFKYALTSYNEFNYQRIDLDTHYDIDVDVTVATNDEFRANKFTVELETNTRKGGYDQMQQDLYCTSTTGYVKIVYPATGESHLWGGGDYYSNWHLSINYNNIDDYKNYYIYSCDSTGKAMGYIKEIRSGRFTETIDLSGLKYLNTFELSGPFYGESIDFSGLNYLNRVAIGVAHLLKNIIGLNSKKLDFFSLQNADLIENIDISELTNLTYLALEYLPLLESLDIQNNTKLNTLYIGYVDITLDVTGLTNLNTVQYNKLAMTSDDVDDLLIQLASTDLIGSGNVSIDRISRSSYSDDAFNTLMSRSWNINLGGGFYPDLIEPTKLVLTVDPNLVNKISENLYTNFTVGTSTGYWIGKLWNGRIVGYLPIINLNGSFNSGSINETFRLATENATFEIYSCDYYGIPQGEITSFELSEGFVFSDIDTSELTELIDLNLQGSGSIESLDLKLNINLETINLSNCTTIDSIDVTGLTSLKHINVVNSSLSEVIGFSTLSSLETIEIQSLPNLSYLSFAGLNNINSVYINEDDLYDSTHVDTMLSELNANSAAAAVVFDVQIAVKQAEKDAKQAEIVTKQDERTLLYSIRAILDQDLKELNEVLYQLIEDGADQSLIDAKQAELAAKQAELATKQAELAANAEETNVLESSIMIIETLIKELDDNKSFSGRQVNTYYMARTSASDADYDSLIAFGWTLNLGEEFIYPYSQPVKGFVTIDWNSNENSDDYFYFGNFLRFKSTTGYVKIKSGRYFDMFSVNSDPTSSMDAVGNHMQKGVMEFYSCDSHGRPAGSIIGFGKTANNYSYVKSFDISNLTDIDTLYFESGFSSISTINLSSNINIKSFTIIDWNNLQSIVGFEDLVNLKDIYMSGCSSLDIPVDFSSMVDLQRIYLKDIGINKNSRLNVSGLTKLQYIDVSWTNILSVDLDNVLLALDAAGLDSSFDFNYEGHLSHLQNMINLFFGMGIGYNPESASAFTSLQSKGWYLSVGDQIINSVEVPTKGIARWGMETGMARLYFYTKPGMDVRIKNPDGSSHGGPMINFDFDSSMLEADRFVEFWAVDNYGRPRHDGITEIYDWWNTGATSLEVNNITSITNIDIPYYKGTSLDVSGMTNLTNLTLNNSNQLESLNVDGCSKIRTLYLNECNNLQNIDQLLQDLDSTGSEGNDAWGYNVLVCKNVQRTNASDVAADSLFNKRWNIDVKEPAGTPVVLHVNNGEYFHIDLSTSGGAFKVLYPTGTDEFNALWNDQIYNSCKYNNSNEFSTVRFTITPSFTGDITIISCDENGNASGQVRGMFIEGNQNYTFDLSTITKVRAVGINYPSVSKINQFSLINLTRININYGDNDLTTLNLSNITSKYVGITGMQSVENLILNSNTTDLYLANLPLLTSINLPSVLKTLEFTGCASLSIVDLPTTLININLSGSIIGVQSLDLSNFINLKNLNLTSVGSILTSIDITGLQKLENINFSSTYIDTMIGLESSKLINFSDYSSYVTSMTYVLPTTIRSFTIGNSSNITTLDVSVVDNEFLNETYFVLNYCDSIESSELVLPSVRYINLQGNSLLSTLPILDTRTDLTLYGCSGFTTLDFGGRIINELKITVCNNLTSIVGLSGNMQSIHLNYSKPVIDFSNLNVHYIYLRYIQNYIGVLKSNYLDLYYCNNFDISGSTIENQIYAAYNNGVLNLSNINVNKTNSNLNIFTEWNNNLTSVIFDGTKAYRIYTRNNNFQGSNGSVSLLNSVLWAADISLANNGLKSIDATDASIYSFTARENNNLNSVKLSLKGSYGVYMNRNPQLSNVEFYDAQLSSQLYVIDLYYNSSFSTTTVDAIINSVSQTGRNNGVMVLTRMNNRSSVSQTAYTKLSNQGWNLVNNNPQ